MPARKKIDLGLIEEEVKKESLEPERASSNEAEDLDKEQEREFKREQIKTWQSYNSTGQTHHIFINQTGINIKKFALILFSN